MATYHVNKQIQNMASALCLLCKIEQGSELVVMLGHGDESNNYMAMESWVAKHLHNLKELSPKQQLEKLRVNLLYELESWNY